ncbi:DUF2281 domain-containing protein [Pseudanabaena biceps]|nr:DUF2281 domain-containing protein [Pseudanabaena biceps]
MITVETIVNELNSLPEPLLAEVLSFIRGAKNKFVQPSQQVEFQRVAGLHEGQIWMSDDFNESLPDEFWLGDDDCQNYGCIS